MMPALVSKEDDSWFELECVACSKWLELVYVAAESAVWQMKARAADEALCSVFPGPQNPSRECVLRYWLELASVAIKRLCVFAPQWLSYRLASAKA
jgi:hypothetical protein